ncbi:prolyl oligopeptidase family domain-containing protein [Phthorimaea operculella]|nr:prolyl oligopeptidase family domain-containing protein [Phthorimaea operculella]
MRSLVVLVLALLGYQSETTAQLPLELRTFSLEELIPLRPDFFPDRLTVQWTSDTEYVFSEPNLGVRKYNAATDSYVTLLDVDDLMNLSRYSVSSFSKDEKYLLLATNKRKVYRYSSIAEYSVYDIENKNALDGNGKTVIPLSPSLLQVVVWGAGRSLAYVKDNNVYYVKDCSKPQDITPLTNEGVPGQVYFGVTDWIYEDCSKPQDITPLTNEGVPGQVYFGVTDWIYEEEIFNSAEALWFSPEGTYLAVASFNDSKVESAVYPFYGHPADLNFQYPHEIRFKYPKVGRANPIVGLRVFKPNDPTTDAWNIPAPVDLVGADHILARVNWASDHNLLVLWMNRRQSLSVLINCDLMKDQCSIVKQDTEPEGWIDIQEPLFDKTGTQMVQIEPSQFGDKRYLHAVHYGFVSAFSLDLTPGNSTVTEILSWNSAKDILYYILAPEDQPWLRQLWTAKAGDQKCVSCKEPTCHNVNAMMSAGGSYGVLTCTASNAPPKTFLYDAKTENLKLLKDNTRLLDKLSRYTLPMLLFNKISLGPDVTAHIKLMLPPTIKKDEKYPMIVRVYAGPGTSRVKDGYDLEYYNWYLSTNRSFIVASIDVRGSGVMNVESMHAINNALGTVEVTDTLDAIRNLVQSYSFIDPAKVGVWGWSYGGFATTMMLILDDKKTVAYSIYTERYMDTPVNNPIGYHHSDLMAHAEKLRGRKYMLVHGTGDDNVHYQHSLQLAKVLQHSDIEFEQVSYTDETHSLLGVSRHFYHTLDRFWSECFHS